MFMTASHWTLSEVNDEIVAQADAKFMPMIMNTGADQAFMVQTGDDSMMVVIQFPDSETGQAALSRIADIRAMAAEEFGMTMQNAVAGPVRAHR